MRKLVEVAKKKKTPKIALTYDKKLLRNQNVAGKRKSCQNVAEQTNKKNKHWAYIRL